MIRMIRTIRAIACVLLSVACAPAQIVRVANHSEVPFAGWVRTTIDKPVAVATGTVGQTRIVTGRRIGTDLQVVDLRVALAPREQRSIDLAAATPWIPPVVSLPADVLAHFGGWVAVGGVPLPLADLSVDGAAVVARMSGRVTPMLWVDVWATWYPDEPGVVQAEVTVTASNPSVPDGIATVPAGGLRLTWGDSLVHVAGSGWGGTIVPAGPIADGQAWSVPVTLAWPRHFATPADWIPAIAAANQTTCAVGVTRLWPDGNPATPVGFDAVAWTKTTFPEAVRRLATWEGPIVGPAPMSSTTGSQEDQTFVRGECFAQGGVGAERVAYLSALQMSRRPCHHLEQDGRQADPAQHAGVMFWFSRPHPATRDLLGKTRIPTIEETHGWTGSDDEHRLVGTLVAAARLSGSRALQHELRQQAMIYLWEDTVPSQKPGWSTNGARAARAAGWAGILVALLHHNLEDRALAARVVARWQARVREVYIPAWGAMPFDLWDPRVDARLEIGAGKAGVLVWHQAVAAYGIDLACRQVGPVEGRALALRGAKAVLQHAYERVGTRWREWDNISVPPPSVFIEGDTAHRTGWFATAWLPCAAATVLLAEPQNEKARAIWTQILSDVGGGSRSWMPPGVQ